MVEIVNDTEAAKSWLLSNPNGMSGFDEKYGARPLRRAIQKYLEDPLAEEIINSQIKPGDTLHVDYDTEAQEVKMHVEKGTPPPAEE